ncbi:hypothetical protein METBISCDRAFT_24019 [Metschnikowia bicuspidata]|uniref:Uncharacterized protein n=1 Tax=Metschnikowia bicuspidata TaxID=27322 RepID=A0A4P9ZAP0_9ASCO|nr:hypothetical protein METBISCDRAFT_24019 [Metschnikowia bicuspidata]
MRERRQVIDSELSEREYTVVTKVLEAIKNTDLAPVVLHYFTSNAILKVTAIKGVLFVVKSHLIDAAALLKLLVQSGVVTFVINDIIADCAFFVKFSVLKSEFHVDKRDLDRVVLNVMESLIESGLATQVVKASLKDPQFFTFSASLLDTLYGQGHLKLLALMAAIS